MPPAKRRRSNSPTPQANSKKAAASNRPSTNSATKVKPSQREWRQWHQQQSHDYNTHQFLDASATVHAGLFGARRLPEIKGLWRQLVQGELDDKKSNRLNGGARGGKIKRAGESGGGKISSRHLRRRTNSHRRRRRYRFPTKKVNNEVGGDVCGTKDGSRNVEKSNGNGTESGESAGIEKKSCSRQKKQKKEPCRRARRKPALMKATHSTWWQTQTVQSLQPMHSNEPKCPHKWIPTQMWHAKRFHVSPSLFGWCIPLVHCNRGSRASLRLASSESSPKCTIQDATWEINGCAVVLEIKREGNSSSSSSQQPLQTIKSILQRICGYDAPFLNEEHVVSGERSGEGLIHEIDASPLQPIGPASFIFNCQKNYDGSENTRVSILVHPAIHQKLVSLLTILISDNDDANNEVAISKVPLALLRIRGRASTSTLCNLLGIEADTGVVNGNESHGTLIEGEGCPEMYSKSVSNTITNQSPILIKSHQPNQNYRHLPHNLPSSGWDVFCHPSIGLILFLAFVNKGGACPIGLVEDSRACLEAYPPLPIFPRDFPDTEEGKSYWEGGEASSVTTKEDNDNKKQCLTTWTDWAVIRACVEGSWGRINTPLKRTIRHKKQHDEPNTKNACKECTPEQSGLAPPETQALSTKTQLFGREAAIVHWASLITPMSESTIAVRGSFGIPFLQLLHGCGRLVQSQCGNADDKPRRRPRRKVRSPYSTVHASALSKEDLEAHSNLCQQMRASLSLPALLRCELYCEGKGSLNVGDFIFPMKGEDIDDSEESCSDDDGNGNANSILHTPSPLGVVVASGFSPSRGRCHGAGFISAAKFIDAVDATVHGIGMAIPQSNGKRKMALRVMIGRDASCSGCVRYVLLSILL